MNSMWKECKIIMLPTDKKSKVCLDFKTLTSYQTHLINVAQSWQELYVLSNDEIKEGEICPYIMCWNDGNFELFNSNNRISESKRLSGLAKKVLATTDTSLIEESRLMRECFPLIIHLIPEEFIQLFIQKYNSGQVIDKVLIEYEWKTGEYLGKEKIGVTPSGEPTYIKNYSDSILKIKLNENNEISILLPEEQKQMFSREEVIEIAWNAWYISSFQKKENTTEEHFKQWIQENLK